MNFSYNADYDPPIPILEIYLRVPEREMRVGPLNGIVDTGADGTMIPLVYLNQLGAVFVDNVWISSHWGERRQVAMYLVDIQVGQLALPGVYVVGDEQGDEFILGRNFLNRLRLLLDGPGLTSVIRDA